MKRAIKPIQFLIKYLPLKDAVIPLFLLFFSALLEFLLVLLLPILLDNQSSSLHYIEFFFDFLGTSYRPSQIDITWFVLIGLAISIVLSIISMRSIFLFGSRFGTKFANDLFSSFTALGYWNQVSLKSSYVQNVLTVEINRIIDGILLPVAQAMGRGLSSIAILIALSILDLKTTAIFAMFALVGFGALGAVQFRVVSRCGQLLTEYMNLRAGIISDFFYDHKRNVLLNKRIQVSEDLFKAGQTWARAKSLIMTMGVLPKYVIDTTIIVFIVIGGISVNVMELKLGATGLQPELLIYAFIRTLPFITQLYLAILSVAASRPAVDYCMRLIDFSEIVDPVVISNQAKSLKSVEAIEACDFFIKPSNQTIGFKFYKNQLNIICGKSGAGKTWLVDTLVGLRDHSGYFILHEGSEKITVKNLASYSIDYLEQELSIPETDACQFVTGSHWRDLCFDRRARYMDVLEAASLTDEGTLDLFGGTRIESGGSNISGGQKRRLSLARALYTNSELIVLDEPTAGLDSYSRSTVIDTIHRLCDKRIIICITHDSTLIRGGDNLVQL